MIKIVGGNKLYGDFYIDAAKNAVLPIMAASLLTKGTIVLQNTPCISDCEVMADILTEMGGEVIQSGHNMILYLNNCNNKISKYLAGELRSSVFLLGAMLCRFGEVTLPKPGGCNIGKRPIDIHIKGLKDMNVDVVEKDNCIYCNASNIKPNEIELSFPSVGATENLMMVALRAKGITIIRNAAREPEIEDLARFLCQLGAHIRGAGTSTITIKSNGKLFDANIVYQPIGDRIVAGTIMIATALCKGKVTLHGVKYKHIRSLVSKLNKNTCKITHYNDKIIINSDTGVYCAKDIQTAPYPGFPTDLQSQMLVYNAISKGKTIVVENLFETRFRQVEQLNKMGANIEVIDNRAIVDGVNKLKGNVLEAFDLRGGASLILAGLVADGVSEINGETYIDRGYDRIEEKLAALGADITRI